MSIAFSWKLEDFADLVASCERDTATPYILKYMPRHGKVLEAGCGLARHVKFLSERGYDVVGIELSQDTIDAVKTLAPELDVRQGDVSKLDFRNDSICGVISLGVVEHFIRGPKKPLREMFRILKPGHYGVISVPSFNYIRKIKYHLSFINPVRILKQSPTVRRLFGNKPLKKRGPHIFIHHRPGVVPYKYRHQSELDGFFEYLFSKQEFEEELKKIGFTIVESAPIALIDGIYHDVSKRIVLFRNWTFYPSTSAKVLNYLFGKIPFFHNHMHLCVVRK